jgi:hypothetical protein
MGSQEGQIRKVEERRRLTGLGRGGCAQTPKPRFRWVCSTKMASLLAGLPKFRGIQYGGLQTGINSRPNPTCHGQFLDYNSYGELPI